MLIPSCIFRLDQKWSRVDQIWSNLGFRVGPLLVQGGPDLVQGGPLLVQPRVSSTDNIPPKKLVSVFTLHPERQSWLLHYLELFR